MGWLIRWLKRHPEVQDYLEGAAMVWVPNPPPPRRNLYIKSDFDALASDWKAVAADLRYALDKENNNGRAHQKN